MPTPLKITLCAGPSCTSLGADKLELVLIQYAKSYHIPIEITHRPCANQCSLGPHVIFDGNECSCVRPADIPYFLKKYAASTEPHK